MVETVSIFVTTIINESLLISFILSGPEDFAVEVENYRLDYLQDDWGNEDLTSINQAPPWPNDLTQPADNFVLSNEKRNLVDRFERDSIFEFNLISQEPLPRQSSLSSCHDTQTNAALKWDISNIKHVGTRTPGFDMVRRKVKNTFGFQPYKWQAVVILDILKGVDVVVHVGTSSGKSLPFQAIPTVKIGAIVLVVSPTVALIEDQVDELLILLKPPCF